MKVGCSVPILTLNSRAGLEKLLPMLLPVFDDVFIIDGNSTDGTREYAAFLGVRVEDQVVGQVPNAPIQNFAEIRERSWGLAKHDWIFYVDSDEVPSRALLNKVTDIVFENRTSCVHEFTRKACLPDGRVVEEAFFYPEYCLRLFAKSSGVRLRDRLVHERLILPPGVTCMRHSECLEAGWPSPEDFWRKQLRYLQLERLGVVPGSVLWLFRWGIGYNVVVFLKQAYRAVRAALRALISGRTSLPIRYTLYFLGYRFLSIQAAFYAWSSSRRALKETKILSAI